MRVAYVTLAPFISGAERSLQTVLREIPKVGIAPLVICPQEGALVSWCQSEGITTETCSLPQKNKWNPLRWWWGVERLKRLFRQYDVSLIHSNQVWSYPAVGQAARQLGLPRVCHLRDEINSPTASWWLADGVEAVVCISEHIAHQFQIASPHPQTISRTMLNPVSIPELPSDEEQRHQQLLARDRMGLDSELTTFGFIAQIVPVKGLTLLLKSLTALAADNRWQLVVAGHDPRPNEDHLEECRNLARQFGLDSRVKFVGFLTDTTLFYQAVDVVVVPSQEEPLGRIPLEAGAYQKPAVAFAVGGLPETIRNGETGWLVSPGDTEALSVMLLRLLDSTLGQVGIRARKWVEEVANPEKYCKGMRSLYDLLLARTNSPGNPRFYAVQPGQGDNLLGGQL